MTLTNGQKKSIAVMVKDTGEAFTTFDNKPWRLHQWFVDGEKHEVVWIDMDGRVVAFQTQQNGTPIFVQQRFSPVGRKVSGLVAGRGARIIEQCLFYGEKVWGLFVNFARCVS